MDFNPVIPIWLQVVTDIKHDVIRGIKPPGSKLPGGRDLAIEYSINPNTAARVYQELEKQGICETRRGLGTFVTEDETVISALRNEMARTALRQFLTEMENLGYTHQETVNLLIREDNNDA